MVKHMQINKYSAARKQKEGQKHMVISTDAGKKNPLIKFNVLS
jgi:hypothetical protein